MESINDSITKKECPENIALLGVKGVGKTSIIENLFSPENKKLYYNEANVVVSFVSVPETNDNLKSFYSYLLTSIFEGLDAIEEYDEKRYDDLIGRIMLKKQKIQERSVELDEAIMHSILYKTIDLVQDNGIKLLLVFDDFERVAASPKLKNAQYRCMRELANSGKISLFISTGEDLTKVSAEMVGSGFENIFKYIQLRGIRIKYIEEWVDEATDGTGVLFDDDVIDWIEEISGGIPEIISTAGEVAYQMLKSGEEFNEKVFEEELYGRVYPLMKRWWKFTDEIDHHIFMDVIEKKAINSVNMGCLVKKGYLERLDSEKVVIITPLLERYALEMRDNNATNELLRVKKTEDSLGGDEQISGENMMWQVANEVLDTKIDIIVDRIGERLERFVLEGPTREEFYTQDQKEIDFEKYGEAIATYMCDKLTRSNDEEICAAWKIDPTIWENYSAIRRNDCSMAYSLITHVFATDVSTLDYTPVTVMLANFLEGILNDSVLKCLKKYMPQVKVQSRRGYVPLKSYSESMTIGGFEFVFRNENVNTYIKNCQNYNKLNLDIKKINDFQRKLAQCQTIRNYANHHGQITTYKGKNTFIENMFFGQDSMVEIIRKLDQI